MPPPTPTSPAATVAAELAAVPPEARCAICGGPAWEGEVLRPYGKPVRWFAHAACWAEEI